MADTYKLTFFNVYGRGQGIRYTFAVGKIPFEDDKLYSSWEEILAEWPKRKPTTECGYLPILTINGKETISQSLAIGRYAAKVANLYGSNVYEEGRIDMIAQTCNELREEFIFHHFLYKGDKEDIAKRAEKALNSLETILGQNEYFVGGKISWADIHFYHCLEILTEGSGIKEFESVMDDTPNLRALYKRVGSHPEIVSYKDNQKKPFISIMPPRPPKPEQRK